MSALTAVGLASEAVAAPAPVGQPTSNMATADFLPTTQIDGVVWSQAVVGNTVFAGGKFTNARPAGAAAGVNTVTRNNFLSYNITNGVLNAGFAPSLNAQVKAVAASPDGTRVYVGGDFTTANGVNRYRLAAYDTATGALITTFAPILSTQVSAIAATNSTVYVGGQFTSANGVARNRLAAFNASNGALTTWNPNADFNVNALTISPDGQKVIAGGQFEFVGGQPAYGMAAINATTGALMPWPVGSVVRNAGTGAGITSLSNDGTYVYGTGYIFGRGGTLEGTFSARLDNGTINWIEDCHGDTYGAYSAPGAVYTVGHPHTCVTVGGFPEVTPTLHHHAVAFSTQATGTLNNNTVAGYTNFGGRPSPTIYNWFPDFLVGSFTGQWQAGWHVTGNSQYVVIGGEFPAVNNQPQQGLVRFAVRTIAPKLQGPRVTGANFTPTLTQQSSTSVRVSFPANWDRDDQNLTYNIIRSDRPGTPVYTGITTSQFWNRPTISYTDTGLSPGTTYTYSVRVNDPDGNTVTGNTASITTPGASGSPTASFTSSCSNLACSFNGSGSTAASGTSITGYAWDFGDGTTGTGVSPSRTYTAPGTYTVRLTVTANNGSTGTTTRTVTATNPGGTGTPGSDAFSRTLSGSWGSANAGGAWTVSPGSAFSVDGSVGRLNLASPGAGPTAYLNSTSLASTNFVIDTTANAAATGGGIYITQAARRNGSNEYRLKQRLMPGGVVHLVLSKLVGGTETTFTEVNVTGLNYSVGNTLRTRFRVTGTTTATLTGKIWNAGSAEPGAAQITATDTTAALQGAGSVGLQGYLSGSATTSPVGLGFDNLSAVTD